MRGVRLGPGCRLGKNLSADCGLQKGSRGSITIGAQAILTQGVVVRAWGGSVQIGERVYVGEYAVIYGHGGVTIGNDVLISMHCRILSSNHTVPDRDKLIRYQPDTLLPTHIGNDVWLGAGVTVLGGVTIGDGCVVGAMGVVTHDLPPYAIAMGVPAQIVKYRR
jgi:acetyltransferase-like isoleucine patch superfamily enzyme